MADPRPLTRDELAAFLPSQRAIRAFEKLFELIPDTLTSSAARIQEVSIEAATSVAKAQQALDLLERLVSAVELLALHQPDSSAAAEEISIPQVAAGSIDDVAPPVFVGTVGVQNADRVSISGGVVSAELRNNQAILLQTTAALNNSAAAAIGTLNNAPAAGDPTKWVTLSDNGTLRYIPAW